MAGVGAKTAAALINEFGDLAGIRAAVARTVVPKPPLTAAVLKKMHAAADYLDAAPVVVAVAKDIDMPPVDGDLPRSPADPDALADLAEAHGLESSLRRLGAALRLAGRRARLRARRPGGSGLGPGVGAPSSSVIVIGIVTVARPRSVVRCTRRWRPPSTSMSAGQSSVDGHALGSWNCAATSARRRPGRARSSHQEDEQQDDPRSRHERQHHQADDQAGLRLLGRLAVAAAPY